MAPLIEVTSDEVNHLIYAYLQDSGFFHTAFALRSEGRLDQSPYFDSHIPRGQLVELLAKALLYVEVETHCTGDGLITDCKTPFLLLKGHECSIDSIEDDVTEVAEKPKKGAEKESTNVAEVSKRKTTVSADGDGKGRRSKRNVTHETVDVPMDTDVELLTNRSKDLVIASTPEPDNSILPMVPGNGAIAKNPHSLRTPISNEDAGTSRAVLTLSGHTAEVFVCAWNPVTPGMLATGSKDATTRIWNLPDPPDDPTQFSKPPENPPKILKHLPISDQRDITSLDWNGDGTLLATGSYDSILRVWTRQGDYYMSHPQHQGPIFAIRFSKSGRWLLSASLDGTACVWDVAEKKLHMQLRCHADCCLDIDWFDDTTFASCGADKLIQIMRVGIRDPLQTFVGHTNEVNQIKFNASRTRLASCSDDTTARIWSISSLDNKLRPGGLATSLGDKDIAVVVLEGHKDPIGSLCWCPKTPAGSNELLATASFDGTVRLWDAVTGKCLKTIEDHKGAAYALTFSPDGKYFASGSGDGWLYIYESTSGRRVWGWCVGPVRPGIYELDWQQVGKINRIALCLETQDVGIVDLTRIPAFAT